MKASMRFLPVVIVDIPFQVFIKAFLVFHWVQVNMPSFKSSPKSFYIDIIQATIILQRLQKFQQLSSETILQSCYANSFSISLSLHLQEKKWLVPFWNIPLYTVQLKERTQAKTTKYYNLDAIRLSEHRNCSTNLF